MPDNPLRTASSPSYPPSANLVPRNSDTLAFKRDAATRRPLRASRNHTVLPSDTRASTADSTSRLTSSSSGNTILRRAPLRPEHGHIASLHGSMRLQRPNNNDGQFDTRHASLGRIASVGIGVGIGSFDRARPAGSASSLDSAAWRSNASDGDLSDDSVASRGYRSVSEISLTTSISTDAGYLTDSASIASGRQVSAATITITDSTTTTHHILGRPDSPALRIPTIPLTRAPAVRIAVDALLADCLATKAGAVGTNITTKADPILEITTANELRHLAGQVYSEFLDQRPGWQDRVACATAFAALGLSDGAAPGDIDLAFIRLGLGYAFENGAPRNGDNNPPAAAMATQLAALDRIARLRTTGNPESLQLNAALDRALMPQAMPRLRDIAQRVVSVAVEMAHEMLPRHAVKTMMAASEQNDVASMHTAFQHFYELDRSYASPYESGADRGLALTQRLSPSVRQQFMDIFRPPAKDAIGSTPSRGLHVYLDALQSNKPPVNHLSKALREDQQGLIKDLLATAATLRGEEAHATRNAPVAAKHAYLSLRDTSLQAPPSRLRAIADGLRRYFRPSPLERAQGQIAKALKMKASPRSGNGELPTGYAEAAQTYIRALSSKECRKLSLHIANYVFVKGKEAELRQIEAIHTALDQDFISRNTLAPAIGKVIDALRRGTQTDAFVNALDQLASATSGIDDPVQAGTLLASAVRRLSIRQEDIEATLRVIVSSESQRQCEDGIEAVMRRRRYVRPRAETIRLIPALRGLASALQYESARLENRAAL